MLWIEPCTVFYASLMGGVLGAFFMSYASRQNSKDFVRRVESMWNEDLKTMDLRIQENDKKCECRSREIVKSLSTISGGKAVDNQAKYRNNKGYKHRNHYTQGV